MIEFSTTITLRCDHCGISFEKVGELNGQNPTESTTDMHVIGVIAATNQIRDLGKQQGWAQFLPAGQPFWRDLCDKCLRPHVPQHVKTP